MGLLLLQGFVLHQVSAPAQPRDHLYSFRSLFDCPCTCSVRFPDCLGHAQLGELCCSKSACQCHCQTDDCALSHVAGSTSCCRLRDLKADAECFKIATDQLCLCCQCSNSCVGGMPTTCCKGGCQLCCWDSRVAFPPEFFLKKDVPLQLGCCNVRRLTVLHTS